MRTFVGANVGRLTYLFTMSFPSCDISRCGYECWRLNSDVFDCHGRFFLRLGFLIALANASTDFQRFFRRFFVRFQVPAPPGIMQYPSGTMAFIRLIQ